MFQNAYQSGPSVEIFDPKSLFFIFSMKYKGKISLVNQEKDKNYANLCKIANHNLVKKVFDKTMKGFSL